MSNASDITKLTFEEALRELETLVQKLESGKVPLEESITLYERGELLKKQCEKLLKAAESRVEKITLAADGTPTGKVPLED
jgi:exodeoxyribonuclease VII small subunit